jgi:hypothetical protein
MGVWYTTREAVKSATDSKETARNNIQIDRAIEAASRSVEGQTLRTFYPQVATRTFDWPQQYTMPWRLWLDENDLISVTAMSSGGVAIAAGDYLLRPDTGPPFTCVEVDRSSSASFGGGSTPQRDISITGLWGYGNDEEPAGALAAAIATTTATTVDVTDSAAVGVGSILRVDTERMIVTAKTMLTTGQTGTITLDNGATSLPVADGTLFAVDEVILLDSERMLVEDIAGNALIVKRAWDGSVIAAHTGATIYARRRLTVQRRALGTTAATHANAAAIVKHMPPGQIHALCIAEALNQVQQENSGYARLIGAGETTREAFARGLKDLRAEVAENFLRRARIGTV